jgi:multiple sugar transport system ATP-binding protein
VAAITLERLTKVFADGTRAVSGLDLAIPDRCLMVVVGPSGCGKTTVLRMVAGLEQVTKGEIRIGERRVTRLAAKDRDVAMVFQNYALYPQMTAYENMAFALKLRKLARSDIDRRVREAAHILGIEDLLRKKPKHLSGGQRQRIAMGRAIVREPRAFLMDEPLSNLDAKLRVQMRAEISEIQHRLGTTTMYVTHDQVEAMTIGHLVAVMSRGKLQQVGTPQEVYDAPANLFVATFIGSPAMNLVEATLRATDGAVWADFADAHLRLPPTVLAAHPGLTRYVGHELVLGLRPEDMQDAAPAGDVPADQCIHAAVEHREMLGGEVYLHFSVAARAAPSPDAEAAQAAETVPSKAPATAGRVPFVARVSGRNPAAIGDKIDIAVDGINMYFFDLGTQRVIAG